MLVKSDVSSLSRTHSYAEDFGTALELLRTLKTPIHFRSWRADLWLTSEWLSKLLLALALSLTSLCMMLSNVLDFAAFLVIQSSGKYLGQMLGRDLSSKDLSVNSHIELMM